MNSNLKMTNAEYRLAQIIWETQPVASPKLCELAQQRLGWKRTTTYTMLKKLCERGIMRNEGAVVTSIMDREAALVYESRDVTENRFGGSLPLFISAFLSGKKLSAQEAEKLKELIDSHKEE